MRPAASNPATGGAAAGPPATEVSRRDGARVADGDVVAVAPPRDAERTAAALKLTLALALACGCALSRRLWVETPRDFPTVPLFAWLPRVPSPADYLWAAALTVLLALAVVSKRPARLIVAFVASAFALALWDQTRWQPWFYQYLFMLAALALFPWGGRAGGAGAAASLDACRLVVASVYFWSGVQKALAAFSPYAGLLRPYVPESVALAVEPVLAWLVPAWEVSVGVGLLTRRFRAAAVWLALALHASILLLIVPARVNNVVWPWNAATCAFVLLLFWRERGAGLRDVLLGGGRPLNLVAAALFAVMPALSLFGWWDSYLSAALYSGYRSEGFIHFGAAVRERLPERARLAAREVAPGRYVLHTGLWAGRSLNVPVYPEPRVYRRLALWVCARAAAPDDVTLEIREAPRRLIGERRSTFYDCTTLTRD